MKSHVVILNRAPLASRDGWIHIVPKGELPNAEAGIVQVLDDTAMDSILAGIEKDKNRLGDRWPGVYAGREHFIYDDTKDSAALAWFKDFKKDADGLWAKDDGLTPAGTAAVTNREYKFTSFVSDPKQLQKIDGKRYRIMGIETIGFTNQANGKELLTPITNRADKVMNHGGFVTIDGNVVFVGPEKDETDDGDRGAAGEHPIVKMARKSGITSIGQIKPDEQKALDSAVKRGLLKKGQGGPYPAPKTVYAHPDADIEGTRQKFIQAAHTDDWKTYSSLRTASRNRSQNFADAGASAANQQNNTKNKMKNIAQKLGLAAEASEDAILAEVTKLQNRTAELEPLAGENTKLKNRITEVDSAAVDSLLASHGVKEEKVLNRLKPVILATPVADRAQALVDFGFKVETKTTPARVLNRGAGKPEEVEASAQDEQAKTEKIRNRANELTKGGMKFDAAWAKAVTESNTPATV